MTWHECSLIVSDTCGRTAWHVASASRIIIHAGGFGSPRELSVPSSRVPPRGPRVVAKFAKFAGSAKCPKCPPSAQGRQMLLRSATSPRLDSILDWFDFTFHLPSGLLAAACRCPREDVEGPSRLPAVAYSDPCEDARGPSGWLTVVHARTSRERRDGARRSESGRCVWRARLRRPRGRRSRAAARVVPRLSFHVLLVCLVPSLLMFYVLLVSLVRKRINKY